MLTQLIDKTDSAAGTAMMDAFHLFDIDWFVLRNTFGIWSFHTFRTPFVFPIALFVLFKKWKWSWPWIAINNRWIENGKNHTFHLFFSLVINIWWFVHRVQNRSQQIHFKRFIVHNIPNVAPKMVLKDELAIDYLKWLKLLQNPNKFVGQ